MEGSGLFDHGEFRADCIAILLVIYLVLFRIGFIVLSAVPDAKGHVCIWRRWCRAGGGGVGICSAVGPAWRRLAGALTSTGLSQSGLEEGREEKETAQLAACFAFLSKLCFLGIRTEVGLQGPAAEMVSGSFSGAEMLEGEATCLCAQRQGVGSEKASDLGVGTLACASTSHALAPERAAQG